MFTIYLRRPSSSQLTTVRTNIERYGAIEVCHFVRGWFSETMPHFGKPVGVAYVDVDLVSSTGDCLRHLYPLLVPGGAIYSKDAHLSGIVELLENERFWNEDVGVERPVMERACEQITGGTGVRRTNVRCNSARAHFVIGFG